MDLKELFLLLCYFFILSNIFFQMPLFKLTSEQYWTQTLVLHPQGEGEWGRVGDNSHHFATDINICHLHKFAT